MSRNRREAAIAAHTTDFSSLKEGREKVSKKGASIVSIALSDLQFRSVAQSCPTLCDP